MWFFRSPTIVHGEDAITHLAELKGSRAFVVTDKTVRAARLIDPVLIQLEHAGMQTRVYDAVTPEPTVAQMRDGGNAMAQFDPDWIIAVGGGSVMDAAKGMWVSYENPNADLSAISPLEAITLRERARLCCIPTTAGTGSEVTYAFVVSITDENGQPRKLGVGHPDCTPDYAIVDPLMTRDLPPAITADTGMDALVQAIEGYTATWANHFTDGLCLTAIKLLFEHLPVAYSEGGRDLEARDAVGQAAAIAGLGYINSMVGAAHSMAHAAGAALKLQHGRACGLFLPGVILFSCAQDRPDDVVTRYADITRFLGEAHANEAQAGAWLAQRVRALATQLGQPFSLRAAGVSRDEFDAALNTMVENALGDTVIFTAPRQPSGDDLITLFRQAF